MVRKCSFSNVSGERGGDDYLHFIANVFTIKGQIISECPYEITVLP